MTSCFNFFMTIFFLLLSLPALDGCLQGHHNRLVDPLQVVTTPPASQPQSSWASSSGHARRPPSLWITDICGYDRTRERSWEHQIDKYIASRPQPAPYRIQMTRIIYSIHTSKHQDPSQCQPSLKLQLKCHLCLKFGQFTQITALLRRWCLLC